MTDFKSNYKDLISKAKLENRSKEKSYFEQHHIVPRSLGGPDTKENLILLTPQEHYMAHYYLWKFTGSKEMACAFWFMSIHKSEGVQEIISSDEYAQLREDAAEASRERQEKPVYCLELDMDFPSCKEAAKHVAGSSEHSEYIGTVCNKKIKAAFEWKDGLRYHWCWLSEKEEFKKHKEELMYEEAHRQELTNQHISEVKMGSIPWNKGISCSEETREKISTAHRGKASVNKGKSFSNEACNNMSNGHKEKIKCIELNRIFETKKEAANFLGMKTCRILVEHARNGEVYKGYHWELVSNDTPSTTETTIKLPAEIINVK